MGAPASFRYGIIVGKTHFMMQYFACGAEQRNKLRIAD